MEKLLRERATLVTLLSQVRTFISDKEILDRIAEIDDEIYRLKERNNGKQI